MMKPNTPARKGSNPIQKQGKPVKHGKAIQQKQGFWQNRILLLIFVLVITFLVFLPTLKSEFIQTWDDGVYVTENASILHLNFQNIKVFFTKPVNGTYVPIPLLSFALEYQVFGLHPLPFHLNNLLLHLLCTSLAFYILILLRLPVKYAAFGALLFGIQPMRVETVAWVTERKDLLFSVFYLGAIITYIKFILSEKSKQKYFIFTLILFILSLFSKIQAVTLPLTLLLLDYFFDRPLKLKLIWEKIPFFALSLAFGIFGFVILKQVGSLDVNEKFSLLDRIFFGMYSLSAYVIKVIAPLKLSAFYPYPIKSGQSLPILYYLSPVFLTGLAVLVFLTARKTKAVVFGSLFFFVNIMFLLQILGAGQGFQADRFTYIPYFGLFFMAAWAAQKYAVKGKITQPIVVGLILIFTVFFSTQTYSRAKDWTTNLSLWNDVIEKYPGKIPTAYANRASAYRKLKQADFALLDYNYAVILDNKDGVSRMNRGNIYFDMGKDSLAFLDYKAAMALNLKNKKEQSEVYKLYANLGAIYGRRGVYDSAFFYLNKSLSIDSTFEGAWMNRGLTNEVMKNWGNAISDFQRYLHYSPEDEKVHSDIGVCYQNLGKFEESLIWFGKAIALKPQSGFYYLNRSYSYNALKDLDKARQDVNKARQLGTQIPPAYLQALGL